MKVLMLNGSSHEKGCTYTALTEVGKILKANGIDYEIFNIGSEPLRDCIGCGGCKKLDSACIFNDDKVNEFLTKAKDADGFIFGTPVYFAHPTGRIISLLDRAFVAGKALFLHKPASCIVSARRGGTTASFDVLNKYLAICQMPIVSSSYWNMVHGNTPEQVLQDVEGIQTMRNLGANMAWLLKSIECAKNHGIETPQNDVSIKTNFIR